jgi:uncharacterized lipoprotein YbaY
LPAEAIEGRILFGEDARPFQDASVEVVLEDTTYADEPAVPVARLVLRAVSYDGAPGGSIAFALPRPPAAPGRRHTLRILVDVDGDGRLGKNDYRNAESVSIPPDTTESLTVRVKRVD